MGTKVTRNDSDYVPCPAGAHAAVIAGVIDLGTQRSEQYNKSQHKLRLEFEVTTDEQEEPFRVSKQFTASLHKKSKLAEMLTNLGVETGEDEFDVADTIGTPCMVTVVHKDKEDGDGVWANINGIAPLPKAMQPGPDVQEPVKFDIDEPDMEVFAEFSDYLKGVIQKSDEWELREAMTPGEF